MNADADFAGEAATDEMRPVRKGGARVIVCRLICSARPLLVALALMAIGAHVPSADAQQSNPFPPQNTGLVGVGILPGLGVVVGFVAPARTYTREALIFGNTIIPTAKRDGSAYVAVAIGAAVRVVGIAETLGITSPRRYDLDFGIRLGPSLVFEFDESQADKNKRFNVAAEPFVRFARKIGRNGRAFYAEAGLIRPTLRVGIALGL